MSETGDEEVGAPRKRGKSKKADKASDRSFEDSDLDKLLPRELPEPAEIVKGLGDMYAKYGIGEDPAFKIAVYRIWPKIAPGGMKFDGYYEEWDTPLSMDQIVSEYGGGQYRIVVMGPHPENDRQVKQYDSLQIGFPGDPKWSRVPRALQGKQVEGANKGVEMPPMPSVAEPPKLAEVAMKMATDMADRERDERHRAEARGESKLDAASKMFQPVVEAERRRADDVVRIERERSDERVKAAETRLAETRSEVGELRAQMEQVARSQPRLADEIKSLADAGLFRSGEDGQAVKTILNQVLERHRADIETLQKQNQSFVESMRQAHEREIESMRSAHQRELDSEREAGRARETRAEERLASEREDRRRWEEQKRREMEDRDKAAKDRLDQALDTQRQNDESRRTMMDSIHENRLNQLQLELDRLRSEASDAKTRDRDQGDLLTQLHRMKEISAGAKEILGLSEQAPPASGGIGLSGAGEDWKSTLAEGVMERLPVIMDRLFSGGGPATGQQQPPPAPGTVISTAQGLMVVVQNPTTGELGMTPKADYDRWAASQRARAEPKRRLLPDANATRPRRVSRQVSVTPNLAEGLPRQKPPVDLDRSRGVSVVPNLSEGLPRMRPPWEGGGTYAPSASAEAPADVPVPRVMNAPIEDELANRSSEPMELTSIERQGLKMVAKHVHESVMDADEPEEFVEKMLTKYPPAILQQLVGAYTTDQIIRGIAQVEPNSGGTTPAGQEFVRRAFKALRDSMSE